MEKPIKALFIFPLTQVWGGEKIWLEYLRRINRSRVDPQCMVFGRGELLDKLDELHINYYCLPLTRIRNIISYVKSFLKMVTILENEKFDVVNSLGVHFLSSLATSFLHIPYIIHIHTIHALPFVDRWCLRRARHIITVSNFSKQFLTRYGVPERYVAVVHNGIDTKELEVKAHGKDIREELRLDNDALLVCYAGRIVRWKNLALFIQAIPEVKARYAGKVKFLFMGETPGKNAEKQDYKDSLMKLAKGLQVSDDVIFMGKRADVAHIVKQIDIFAIPSLLEVCSMSILEAMALTKPVVAMKAGGNPELVTQETGILVEPGDSKGFAAAIATLMNNPEKRNNLGWAGARRIKEFFEIEESVKRIEDMQSVACASFSVNKITEIVVGEFFPGSKVIKVRSQGKPWRARLLKINLILPNGQKETCWVKLNRFFLRNLPKSREIALKEYEILSQLYQDLRSEKALRAIEPVGFIPDYAAVVTKDYSGRKLNEMITEHRCSIKRKILFTRQDLAVVLFSCGRWLAKFQKIITSLKNVCVKRDSLLEIRTVENDLMSLSHMGCESQMLQAVKVFLLHGIPQAQKEGSREVVCHPDLGPRNFLIDSMGGIAVLDFDDVEFRHELEDVALFRVHLDLLRRYFCINQKLIVSLKQSFLDGYQKERGSCVNPELLRFWEVRLMVALVAGEYLSGIRKNALSRWLVFKRTRDVLGMWVKENDLS